MIKGLLFYFNRAKIEKMGMFIVIDKYFMPNY